MDRCKIRYLLIVYVLFQGCLSLHAQNPNKILSAVYVKLNKAKDYTVDVNIKVDLPFIKMLPINAKIYFKQKDKFKVDSKGIAIVPRQGFEQIGKLIGDSSSYIANFQSSELVNGLKTSLLTIIPLSDTVDVVLGKLWVDEKNAVIVKSHVTTRSNGTIVTEYTYGKQLAYGLPDLMQFEVDIKKFKVPKAVAADINSEQKKTKEKEGRKGKIIIRLDNYQINKGINDAVFKK
jgi:hypothetical protein